MDKYFIPCDAHEGCVWVADQQRLYFTTTKKFDPPRIDLLYLDFSDFDLARDGNWQERMSEQEAEALRPTTWIEDANMANSLCLSIDGKALYVAEQGDMERPAQLTRIELADRSKSVVLDNFRGKPFNSLNKVNQTSEGHLIVSDPDYGFRQGFRPPPELSPSIYVIPRGGEPFAFDCGLEMPHGIGLSPDERTIYITDTSNDGGHDDKVELKRRRAVYAYTFDPETGQITNDPRYAFSVDKGVPDGTITSGDALLTGAGDGIYVADLLGNFRGKISLNDTAVNLNAVFGHLFVTADEGVYIIFNWRDQVK